MEDVRDTQAHFRHFFCTSTEEQLPYMVKVSQPRTQSQHTAALFLFFPLVREPLGRWAISCVQERTVVQFPHTAPEVPSAFVHMINESSSVHLCPLAGVGLKTEHPSTRNLKQENRPDVRRRRGNAPRCHKYFFLKISDCYCQQVDGVSNRQSFFTCSHH